MTNFLVSWEIDIEADSPQDAAKKALEIMQDPESIATFFKVQTATDDWTVDLGVFGDPEVTKGEK